MKNSVNNSRREFLSKAAVAGTITIAPGVLLHQTANASTSTKADDEPVSSENRWGMLIDTAKCATGCTDCVDACNEEHGLIGNNRPASDTQYIRKVTLKDKSTGHESSLPLMCQHCETAPCADVCPTGASFVREDGIALVDKHICIGCRYCMMACPYNARSFIHENVQFKTTVAPRGKGCVESCNLCVHRRDNGGTTTACQDACRHEAIVFGDLKDPNSAVSQAMASYPNVQIRADLKLNTGVRYTDV